MCVVDCIDEGLTWEQVVRRELICQVCYLDMEFVMTEVCYVRLFFPLELSSDIRFLLCFKYFRV